MIPHSAPWITAADRVAVDTCLAGGQIASGAVAEEFEGRIRDFAGARWSRSTPDGTTAIVGALRLLGVSAGDEVVLPTYVCIDVERAITAVGAMPRFADVADGGVLTAATAEAAMTQRTRAIIAVHTFGHTCPIEQLTTLGVPVIEDACQAFAGETARGRTGTLGDIGVYSFHATKCLTTGEGGMMVSKSGEYNAGNAPDPPRLSDLQAALGIAQLARYDAFLARRAQIRRIYETALAERGAANRRPHDEQLFRFTFTLRPGTMFEAAADHFAGRGIALRRGVDALLHRDHGLDDEAFPGATTLFARNASVPYYPALTDDQVETVASTLREYDGVA